MGLHQLLKWMLGHFDRKKMAFCLDFNYIEVRCRMAVQELFQPYFSHVGRLMSCFDTILLQVNFLLVSYDCPSSNISWLHIDEFSEKVERGVWQNSATPVRKFSIATAPYFPIVFIIPHRTFPVRNGR